MPKTKDNSKNTPAQAPNIKNIIPDRFTYDIDGLDNFLQSVFHAELEPDEEILTWSALGPPGYPVSEDEFLTRMARTVKAKALYYGTSTVTREPKDGKLYNRKALFKRFYVLVLDDIGTKIPLDKIPEDFKPTYIIESSQNNYQYGYVLETPIDVREQAEALIQLVYEGGYSDAGGKMATKLVRLPDGINGKPGEGRNFHVKLVELDEDRLWSPEAILEKLNIGVNWQDVVTDLDKVMKERAQKGVGASAWSPIKIEAGTLQGVVDPVAEWLYETAQVKQETESWLTIKCPWSDMHTDGNDWASYSPLGWGEPEYRKHRGFHCFHEHCRSRKTLDYLEYVADVGGPAVPVTELAADLVARYVFDEHNYGVWDIMRAGQPGFRKIESFNYKNPSKVKLPGQSTPVAETMLFKHAKNRVDVDGVTYDPTTTAKIVTNRGVQQVNLYTQPEWGDGDYAKADVKRFMAFLKYLIPAKQSREFFLDWLGAKAQSMAFRGPGVLMIAPSQGTGRSTLAGMLAKLFGSENVERVPFERLSSGGGQFNDWIVKPIIVTDETLALGDETNFYKVYERIKELIDTTPQEVRVNPKFGKQRFQITYSSYLMFSNHENAMKIADNDRRIYVLNNTHTPASPEYFVKLNKWINKGEWMRNVWRWLRQRKVDLAALHAPAGESKAKDDMIRASKRPIDVAVEALLKHWPTNLIAFFQVRAILESQQFKPRYELLDEKHFIRQLTAKFRAATINPPDAPAKTRIGNKVSRVRFITGRGVPEYHHDQLTDSLNTEQDEALRAAISEALDEHDF